MKGRPMHRLLLGTAAGVAAVATVAACGGGSSPSAPAAHGSTGSTTAATSSRAAPGQGAGRGQAPAASGTIAAVAGTTMQVQSRQNGQVAVSWTAATTFTQQVDVAAGSLKAGDCVTAVAPSGTSANAASFTASTVSVSTPTDGSCTGGRFGAGGARPSGAPRPSARPSRTTRPSGFPSGAARGRAGFGAVASGSVVSVSGSTLVIAARTFGSGTSTPTTTNKTVTLGSATKITTEQRATASAVKVGRCATARGSADASGAVTATSVAITDPVDGQCGGFGFGGFGGGNGTSGGGNGG